MIIDIRRLPMPRKPERRGLLFAMLVLIFAASPLSAETQTAASARSAAASVRGDRSGARLAQDTCLQCHGTGVGPDLRLQELSYETIRYVARSGLNAMPSFRETEISDGELREVADYLASLRIPAGQTPGPVPGALQSQDKH